MMQTGEMATDVGTVVYGREAVACGLIDQLGSLGDALRCLHRMIGPSAPGQPRQGEKAIKQERYGNSSGFVL